jgi:DnaJ-class molecular chaperone
VTTDPPEDLAPGDEVTADTKSGGPNVCPDCGGTGRVGAERCEECGGTGQVEEAVGGG